MSQMFKVRRACEPSLYRWNPKEAKPKSRYYLPTTRWMPGRIKRYTCRTRVRKAGGMD